MALTATPTTIQTRWQRDLQTAAYQNNRAAKSKPYTFWSITVDELLAEFKTRGWISDDNQAWTISAIEHEDGSGRSFNLSLRSPLRGYCKAYLRIPSDQALLNTFCLIEQRQS